MSHSKNFSFLIETCIIIAAYYLRCCVVAATQIRWQDVDLNDEDVGSQLVPTKYLIWLDLLAGQTGYECQLTIEMELKGGLPEAQVDTLVLHADPSIDINSVLFFQDIVVFTSVDIKHCLRDQSRQLIAFVLADPIKMMPLWKIAIQLSIAKTSSPAPAQRNNLYWKEYVSNGETKLYGVVDLTGEHMARLMFPCFDRKTFQIEIFLTVVHNLRDAEVVSIGNVAPTKETGEQSFVVAPQRVSLQSLALVIGKFNKSISGQLTIRTLTFYSTDLSSHTDTLDIVTKFSDALESYFGAPNNAGKFDIVILPELECSCGLFLCAIDGENRIAINAWGLLIGTYESLLISERSTNPRQKYSRMFNYARALVAQYLGPSLNNWVVEAITAHLSFKTIKMAYESNFPKTFVNSEVQSSAIDLNSSKPIRLDTEGDQCSSRPPADARYFKFEALWSQMVHMFPKKAIINERNVIFKALWMRNGPTNPSDQLLSWSVDATTKDLIDRMLAWHVTSPHYDIINLVEAHKSVEFYFQQPNSSLSANPELSLVAGKGSSSKLARDSSWEVDIKLFVRIKITFRNTNKARQRITIPVDCDGRALWRAPCSLAAPPWFDYENPAHFLYVKFDLPHFRRFAYSNKLMDKLIQHFSAMNKPERIQIIEDLHGLAKLHVKWTQQLCELVAATHNLSTDPDLHDAYLRVHASLRKGVLMIGGLEDKWLAAMTDGLNTFLKNQFTKDLIAARGNFELMLHKQYLLDQLAASEDSRLADQVIHWYSKHGFEMSPHAQSAFYTVLVSIQDEQAQSTLLQRFKNLRDDDYDEKFLIAKVLLKSNSQKIRQSVNDLLEHFSETARVMMGWLFLP